MDFVETTCYRIFDSLINNGERFVLYRLPEQKDIHFIHHIRKELTFFDSLSELNNRQGFVFSPFHIHSSSPLVLLSADKKLTGENNIIEYLQEEYEFSSLDGKIKENVPIITNSRDRYNRVFKIFHDALLKDEFTKLVLSRYQDYSYPSGFSIGELFQRACQKYPKAFIYLFHTPETGTWFGCTPELLLSGNNGDWKTVALAGTQRINLANTGYDWDSKNKKEQQIVSDYMGEQLKALGFPFIQEDVHTVEAAGLAHLKTDFSFKIEDKKRVGELLQTLHPSPAVCGFPKQKAYDFILQNEEYDRKYYSGFLGELDMNGFTNLYVNLRCMQILPDCLRLYAGGGLLSSSTLQSEWEETEEKFKTLLSII